MGNLFSHIPEQIPDELFENILKTEHFRIERIVSDNHASPEGFWYDQPENEWVILIQGSALLQFEEKKDVVVMKPGDYINIPAHTRHRVKQTDPNQKTIWLALHY